MTLFSNFNEYFFIKLSANHSVLDPWQSAFDFASGFQFPIRCPEFLVNRLPITDH